MLKKNSALKIFFLFLGMFFVVTVGLTIKTQLSFEKYNDHLIAMNQSADIQRNNKFSIKKVFKYQLDPTISSQEKKMMKENIHANQTYLAIEVTAKYNDPTSRKYDKIVSNIVLNINNKNLSQAVIPGSKKTSDGYLLVFIVNNKDLNKKSKITLSSSNPNLKGNNRNIFKVDLPNEVLNNEK